MNPSPPLSAGPPGPELLGQLLERHGAALVLYARQLCDVPDDVVQEALIRLAGLPTIPQDATAWLFRCVRNGAISAARAHRRRQRHEVAAATERANWFESGVGDRLDAKAATAALEQLEAAEREIVVARIWGGLTFQQIAALTGLSDSSVHRSYVAALTTLRTELGESCRPNNTTFRPN